MTVARKVFRIEQIAGARSEPDVGGEQDNLRHGEIMRELHALRAEIAVARLQTATPERGHADRFASTIDLIAGAMRGDETGESRAQAAPDAPTDGAAKSRIEDELEAVVTGSEQATQKILAAAEEIDSAANSLSAMFDGKLEQELAQDIQDLVIQIFEACNFQDLLGQRVAKVMTRLKFVEEHIERVHTEIKAASATDRRSGLHGPRLDGDGGHASQDEIDSLFQ